MNRNLSVKYWGECRCSSMGLNCSCLPAPSWGGGVVCAEWIHFFTTLWLKSCWCIQVEFIVSAGCRMSTRCVVWLILCLFIINAIARGSRQLIRLPLSANKVHSIDVLSAPRRAKTALKHGQETNCHDNRSFERDVLSGNWLNRYSQPCSQQPIERKRKINPALERSAHTSADYYAQFNQSNSQSVIFRVSYVAIPPLGPQLRYTVLHHKTVLIIFPIIPETIIIAPILSVEGEIGPHHRQHCVLVEAGDRASC